MSNPRDALCDAVDGSVLMGHMRELARWVKLSGTPDELTSLQYFQARMDDYGYRTDAAAARRLYQPAWRCARRRGQPDAHQHHAFLLA